MAEDYSLPLGLDRPSPTRRRFPLYRASIGLLVLFVGFVLGWALVFRDPEGGLPSVVVDLPVLPAVLPAPPGPAALAPAPSVEPPEDDGGEIIIRDP